MIPAVTSAVNDAMDAMFFDAAEPCAECSCAPTDARVNACLKFHEAMEGEFVLSAPYQTAVALAASFMALEPSEVDRTHAEQIICELANIICGSALSRLDPSANLKLTPPRVIGNADLRQPGAMYEHYRLLDGCLAVSLRMGNNNR